MSKPAAEHKHKWDLSNRGLENLCIHNICFVFCYVKKRQSNRAAIRLKILIVNSWLIARLKFLIAINRTRSENKKHKFVAQNNSIIYDITSIARCKSQQNVQF